MKCYFVATPYHIMAACSMASGMYKNEANILVIYNHFAFDDAFVNKIKENGPFDKIYLYNYSNKSFLSNVKRAINVFLVDSLIYRLAIDKNINEYIFFTLDFLAASYINKKRGNIVSYGDDGMGAYFNGRCYIPREKPMKVLKLLNREKNYHNIKKLYVYKPNYVIANTQFELVKIIQNEDTAKAVEKLVSVLWPLTNCDQLYDCIVYFEQPFASDSENQIKKIVNLLKDIQAVTDKKIIVKMHPRSNNEAYYADFEIYSSKAPFEAILYQVDKSKKLCLMAINSTAVFSPYFIDKLNDTDFKAILLSEIFYNYEDVTSKKFIDMIKTEKGNKCKILQAKNVEDIGKLLK